MTSTLIKWLKHYRVHIVAWVVFILWETLFIGLSFGEFGHPLTYLFHYVLIISLFYQNSLIILPWVFRKNNHVVWRLPIAVVFEIGVFILASYIIDIFLQNIGAFSSVTRINLSGVYVIRTLYRCVQFLGFSTGYYYLITLNQARRNFEDVERLRLQEIIQKQVAQKEAVRAQNAYLMAQINPHFFFNTLDYFYHNARKISPQLAEGISSLADIMRFAINADKVGGLIRLGDELSQVQTLIYLHSVRQRQFLNLDFDEDLEDILFIPLVILTLTENIFKHGIMVDENDPATIKVFADDKDLYIETYNKIDTIVTRPNSSTGLKNIKQRLAAAYGANYSFTFAELDNAYFQTRIKIGLDAINGNDNFSYHSIKTDIE